MAGQYFFMDSYSISFIIFTAKAAIGLAFVMNQFCEFDTEARDPRGTSWAPKRAQGSQKAQDPGEPWAPARPR